MSTKAERGALREKYCVEQLTPVLQAMVAELLKVLPDDPEDYMRTWLDAKIAEEGGEPPHSEPIVLAAPAVAAAPPPADARPSVGTPVEITGEIVQEEEATRLSTLTQLIADTPGASRATMFTVRGSVASVTDKAAIERLSTLSQVIADTPGAARGTVATVASDSKGVVDESGDVTVTVRGTIVPEPEVQRLSTLSQVLAAAPSHMPRGTVVTVRATVTAEEARKLSTLSKVIADTPGAARATVVSEAKKASTLSQVIADTPGAARATTVTTHSQAPLVALRGTVIQDEAAVPVVEGAAPAPAVGEQVTVLGAIVSDSQIVAEQNRMSTLTQLLNDTPGASRGTLMTVRGSVLPEKPTPQEQARLSQFMAANPSAARGTVVTVRGTVKSRPSEVVTAQVVVPDADAQRLSAGMKVSVTGTVVAPAEASRASNLGGEPDVASVLGGLSQERGSKLEPLDSHEAERKQSQRRASEAAKSEQLRVISEQQHAEHEAQEERKSNRKSASAAMDEEQSQRVAEHGSSVRKVSAASLVQAANNP